MTMAPPSPKTGKRGSVGLPSLALLRDSPYTTEHDASVRLRPSPPQTPRALETWFRVEWETALPKRTHERGMEDGHGLGSPRMAPAMMARIGRVDDRGWGISGHDRDGQPVGMNDDGTTRSRFLYYLERMLRSGGSEQSGARSLLRWAYMGFDGTAALHPGFVERIGAGADTDGWEEYLAGQSALRASTIRLLWARCQSEPDRYPICKDCRQRRCLCGERSESQVNAEEAVR